LIEKACKYSVLGRRAERDRIMPSSLILLHAGYVGRVRNIGMAVVSFASVIAAWCGVNIVVGAGLHSYGFGSSDNAWC